MVSPIMSNHKDLIGLQASSIGESPDRRQHNFVRTLISKAIGDHSRIDFPSTPKDICETYSRQIKWHRGNVHQLHKLVREIVISAARRQGAGSVELRDKQLPWEGCPGWCL
tara:strand:- start:189 stop:521 length:333 start_codon:yes stop_codon:yes gene_type:complete